MARVVISERYGGFGISQAALNFMDIDSLDERSIKRDDPRLVEAVEKLGDQANTRFSRLKVIEIPDGIEWHVHEYDGYETLHESHRTWTSDGPESGCA